MDYGQKNQIGQTGNEIFQAPQEIFSGAQAIFSGETDTVKKVEQGEQGKGAEDSAFLTLDEMKNGQEFDIVGDGQVSDTEARIASDAAIENTIRFKDARQEAIDERAAEEIEKMTKDCGDNMAELQTKVDDARWTFLKNAFGRDRGDGLGGKIGGAA